MDIITTCKEVIGELESINAHRTGAKLALSYLVSDMHMCLASELRFEHDQWLTNPPKPDFSALVTFLAERIEYIQLLDESRQLFEHEEALNTCAELLGNFIISNDEGSYLDHINAEDITF